MNQLFGQLRLAYGNPEILYELYNIISKIQV